MEEEIWKPVVGYEGFYEVSNLGIVRGVDRDVWNGHGFYTQKGKVIKPRKNTSRTTPYYYVALSKNGRASSKSLHVVVCTAFHGLKPHDIDGDTNVECMHINGNSLDNRAENLKWGTHTENMNETKCLANHIASSPFKKEVVQLDLSGKEIARYVSARDAARKTGLNSDNIFKCAAGYKYYHTHGGFKWKYLSDYEQEKANQD